MFKSIDYTATLITVSSFHCGWLLSDKILSFKIINKNLMFFPSIFTLQVFCVYIVASTSVFLWDS